MYILLGLLLETIIIEYCIAIILNAPGFNLLKKITIPNIITYTTIIALVLLIGMLSETLPTENPPDNLIWIVDYPSSRTPLLIFPLFELLIIFIMPIILFCYCIKQSQVIRRVRRYGRGKKTVLSNTQVSKQKKSIYEVPVSIVIRPDAHKMPLSEFRHVLLQEGQIITRSRKEFTEWQDWIFLQTEKYHKTLISDQYQSKLSMYRTSLHRLQEDYLLQNSDDKQQTEEGQAFNELLSLLERILTGEIRLINDAR